MKNSTKIFAVGAVCCALPLILPLLAGAAALSFLSSPEALCLAALMAMALTACVLFMRSEQPFPSCMKPLGCGCGCGDVTSTPDAADTAPIFCTLTAGDFRSRVARIRELSALMQVARREDLRLYLSYPLEAAQEVRQLVREEQRCCAFLQFDIQEDLPGIHIVITAPEEAREAADTLFAHFAPDFAQDPNSNPREVLS